MQGMVPLYGFGGVPYSTVRKAAPRNLLDNSDFTNPVNQRGQTSYSGAGYTIDRWQVWNDSITVGNNFINCHATYQFLELPIDKVYTLACCAEDGSIAIASGTPAQAVSATKDGVTVTLTTIGGYTEPIIGGEKNLIWAALYEGEYTAETLPEYQPKGYGAELAECQRYYQIIKKGYPVIGIAYSSTTNSAQLGLALERCMRTTPSVKIDASKVGLTCNGAYLFATNASWDATMSVNIPRIKAHLTFADNSFLGNGYTCAPCLDADIYVSADL